MAMVLFFLKVNFLPQSNANLLKTIWATCEANDSIHIEMIACIPKLVPSVPGDRRGCTQFVVRMYFCKLLILECKFCGAGSHMLLPDRPAQCAGYIPRRFSPSSNFVRSDVLGPLLRQKLFFAKARRSEFLVALHTSWLYN